MRVDHGGEFWHIVIGAVIGAVFDGAVSAISQKASKGEVDWVDVAISAGAGLIKGAVAATGIGALANGVINAAVDSTEYLLTKAVHEEEINEKELLATATISGLSAGKGINGSKISGIYKRSKDVLKTTTSASKRGMYSSKLSSIRKDIFEKTRGTIKDAILSIVYDRANAQFDFWE